MKIPKVKKNPKESNRLKKNPKETKRFKKNPKYYLRFQKESKRFQHPQKIANLPAAEDKKAIGHSPPPLEQSKN